jgi:maltose/moltooligosaccharide transporter
MTNKTNLVPKPKLSFWEIWNMSFGFLGIQFGFALQNANVSRIFQTLGADIGEIPILWIAAPVTGLIVQPIIGYYSDRTWNRLGRRKPYFLIGAIIASIALIIMPNSPSLWVAAGMLWIMDASINISMEPFRAFVGDNLSSSQRTAGFAMQSFFIGVGAVIASMLPWILANWFNVSNEAPDGVNPDTVKWSFYLGAVVFLLAVGWTVLKSKEYSPEEMASFIENQEEGFKKENEDLTEIQERGKKQLRNGGLTLFFGSMLTFWLSRQELDKELYILSFGVMAVGVLLIIAGLMQRNGRNENGFVQIINDFQDMPDTMKQLASVQFFSWFALFSMWIYTTAAVTEHIYGTTDTSSELYNTGANWVGVCFAVYNGVAAAVAFLIPILAKRTSRKMAHIICLLLGALGLGSIFFVSTPNALLVSMLGVGIAWASILSMPYAILTGALPANKMGYYMGVFNFFIVIPQLVAAAILGFFISRFFGGSAIYALLIGGISLVISAALTLRVDDKDD